MLRRRKLLLFLIDLSLTLTAGLAALFFRFGFDRFSIVKYLPPVIVGVAIYALSYLFNGIYRVVWAYADAKDMFRIARAVFLAYLVHVTTFYIYRGAVLPRSVGAMMALASLVLLIGSRLFWAWSRSREASKRGIPSQKSVMIIGAGEAGVMLLEEFQRRPELGKVVGFVDDSPRKIGRTVRGIPVYGPISSIMNLVEKYGVDEVIVAIPSATKDQMKRILSYIDTSRVRLRTLPALHEIIGTKPSIDLLRDVSIQDLLGREEVKIDSQSIAEYIRSKTVMVTGAGGSIGAELCRQIARFGPGHLILLGRGENSIFSIHEELLHDHPDLRMSRVIADVSNEERMREVFERYHPQIVFHAAAHKHVPLMEENPVEAFWVNARGTRIVADLCCEFDVERMILISTDKAVKPSSLMGLSKRLAEMYVRALAQERRCRCLFSIVRFGNVLGSRGSVIPRFARQIERGGPVTVTDPRMKRYFMSIPEAASLVLQAGAYASNGELYVLDMGELVSIEQIAREMIRLAGYTPDVDIKIVYTGMRPGEKLVEELFLSSEKIEPTDHSKIMKVVENEILPSKTVSDVIDKTIAIARSGDRKKITEFLKDYIPDIVELEE
ncbi:MAG TPA: polysaccharide biosynthesis protein [Thermotogae bacterium]|nr:polysaccharide biosynthesis protein [Thermotogota bacterium]